MLRMPNDIDFDETVAAMKSLLKTSARMYMHLAKATIERFGRDGEMTVRYGLRAYGVWRGTEMREAHHALGLDINMKNLIGCWDNASVYIAKDQLASGGDFKDYDTRFDVSYCPAAEAWKEADFHQWGHVYCDEFHQACASAYHPDGNVVIPQNMMKGDDHCHFRWVMPPSAEKLQLDEPSELGRKLASDYVAASDLEAAWLSLKRSNRLMGGRFYTAASVLLDRHGAEGLEVLRQALRNWGMERGRRLRGDFDAAGIAPTIENFVRRHDLPISLTWETRMVEEAPARCVIEIGETPHEEAWADIGGLEVGRYWYEDAYPAMVEAFDPRARARWIALRPDGETVSRLELDFSHVRMPD
ncbi:MAG: L-2-amino-thiazoline-4-carboxylic acid hydrolase [Parvibaculaceae bacterium]